MASKKNSGLGRGIEALFGSDMPAINADETITEIALDDIRPNPYQPRKVFSDDALAELSASIKKAGVFQPIIVRKSQVSGYEIIAGERRFRASKLAGKTTIPAIIREVDDEKMMEVAVLENLQREDLTPLEEAKAYSTLMEKLNLTQTEVSKRLGKSRPYITNYLRLLGLANEVKQLLANNQLSMGQARTLLAVKDEALQVKLAKRTVAQNLTVRQLEALVNELNADKAPTPKKPKPKKNAYLQACEQKLADKFAAKVAIKNNATSHKGKIEINYTNLAELNRLLDVLEIHLD